MGRTVGDCLTNAWQGSGWSGRAAWGERVRQELMRQAFDGVIVFGGDTVYGVHAALGYAPYEARGEGSRPGVRRVHIM